MYEIRCDGISSIFDPSNLSCLLFLVSLARGDFGWCFHADFWYHLKQKILIHAFFYSVFTTVFLVRYSYYYFAGEETGSQILFCKKGEEYHRCCRAFCALK